MEIKFYLIKGTLVRAVRQDFFDNEGYFLEDKIFFQKDYFTKKFIKMYKTPIDYKWGMKDALYYKLKKYSCNEIEDLLRYSLLYKLSSNHNELDFHFNLYIKTASYTDLFYNDLQLRLNTTYYKMDINGTVSGPFYISTLDDPNKIQGQLENGLVLILSRKQLFEPIQFSKTA